MAAEVPWRRLFTFTRLPVSQWKSARTTDAIARLHEEFKRRIKTPTVLPSAETAAMLFWSPLASGQITMRKVDGWQSLGEPPASMPPDPQCLLISSPDPVMFPKPADTATGNFHIISDGTASDAPAFPSGPASSNPNRR